MNQPEYRFYLKMSQFQKRENKILTENTKFSDMIPYSLVDIYIFEESAV
jgi:hypothetical protein